MLRESGSYLVGRVSDVLDTYYNKDIPGRGYSKKQIRRHAGRKPESEIRKSLEGFKEDTSKRTKIVGRPWYSFPPDSRFSSSGARW